MMRHDPSSAPASPKGGRPRDTCPSPGAIRQRRYVARKARRLTIAYAQLYPNEIAALRALGYLRPDELPNASGLGLALERLLDRLGEPESWPRGG